MVVLQNDRTRKPSTEGFSSGPAIKNLPCNARDTSSLPGLRRSHVPQSNHACAPQLSEPLVSTALEPLSHNY